MLGPRTLRMVLWRAAGVLVRALSLLTGQPALWPDLPEGRR